MIKIRNYTQEELEYIRENYNDMTAQELATKLNKPIGSINNATRKMGLIKQFHKPWTVAEIEYLKNNYIEKTSEDIGKHLNRSTQSVNAERDRLGLVRNEPWGKKDVDYLVENFEKMTHAEIGQVLCRTEQAVRAKCFDLGLFKKELPWTDDEINFVKQYYMEMKISDISKILNRTASAIELKASRMGLKKYPYTCDYHYFDEIDTEEKAYWLGFLTADGWISKNDKNNSGVTGIELQYGDLNHLKKFNKSISGNYQITDRWKTCPVSTKDKEKKHHTCCIRIFSLTMYNSLVDKGFTKEKSYDYHIPYLRKDLVRHYVRGYFDGDGCFCYTNKSFGISFITASRQLYDDLLQILEDINIKICCSIFVNEFGTTMYRPEVHKLKDKIKFLDWIYKDANIYLDRKYKKYLKVKNNYKDTQSLAV